MSSSWSWQMGQLHPLATAMLSARCCGLGSAEDEELLPLAGTAAVGVKRCKRERGHSHSPSRRREEDMPVSLKKDTLPAPRASAPTP